jgi:hypothetical protein
MRGSMPDVIVVKVPASEQMFGFVNARQMRSYRGKGLRGGTGATQSHARMQRHRCPEAEQLNQVLSPERPTARVN